MQQATSKERLLWAGPEKAAEQLLFPGLFAPLLGQCQKWKKNERVGKENTIGDPLLFTIDHSPITQITPTLIGTL